MNSKTKIYGLVATGTTALTGESGLIHSAMCFRSKKDAESYKHEFKRLCIDCEGKKALKALEDNKYLEIEIFELYLVE